MWQRRKAASQQICSRKQTCLDEARAVGLTTKAENSQRRAETTAVPAIKPAAKSADKSASRAAEAPPKGRPLRRAFFDRSVHEVAPDLIGATLEVDGIGGVIVEVEAYHHTDPAAHSYGGRTERNAVMFGPPGRAYVYRSYGIHWCLNFVCEAEGSASAVLIRALMPTAGLAAMRRRRRVADDRLLCAGPGRLGEALAITRALNGLPLDAPPFALFAATGPAAVIAGPRIGITKAAELPWRYGLEASPYLSRPFRRAKS